MNNYLIVGRNFSALKNKILERGDEYILLQDVLATKFPDKKFKRRVVADFTDKQALLRTVEQFRGKVDGVITTYENYVLPASWIANYLGLPGLPEESAEACTDKSLMRERFATAAQKISPDYAEINNEDDVANFAKNHPFPLIIKPANLSKSLLVTKAHNNVELISNYRRTLKNIDSTYKKYAPGRKPKLIIEEFMEGPVFSVDAFVDAHGEPHVLDQVVDYQTGYDIGYDDNFHYSRLLPSYLSEKGQQAIREVAYLGCKALGMKGSSAHIEIILTKEGPRIVEIGARNGGYRERMYSLANGIDIFGLALDNSLGKPLDIKTTKDEPCAVLELFPKQPGIFIGINDQDKLEKLQSLQYLKIKQPVGKFIGKSSEGFKMAAIIILHNKSRDAFDRDLKFVNDHVHIITRA